MEFIIKNMFLFLMQVVMKVICFLLKQRSMKKGAGDKEKTETKSPVVAAELPFDSVLEILTRTCHDELILSGQRVCRQWQEIIYNTKFKLMHSLKNQTVSGYFIQSHVLMECRIGFIAIIGNSSYISSHSLSFLPKVNNKIVASTPNGFLCCVNESETGVPTFYVCKPTTSQWIPNPSEYATDKLAMAVKQTYPTLHYKLLRFSTATVSPWYLHCEIFNSNDWAWKICEDIKLPPDVYLDPVKRNVLVDGDYHCLTSDGRKIFVYYIDEEKWRLIDLPDELKEITCYETNFHKKLVNYMGQIAVVCNSTVDECMNQLWVLEYDQLRNPAWKQQNIHMGSIHPIIGCNRLCDMFSNDIMVMKNFQDELILYNWKKGTYITVQPPGLSSFVTDVFPFQSDLTHCRFR